MRNFSLVVLLALLGAPSAVVAEDASANFLVNLFMTVCIPNVGQPAKVRAWAAEKSLQEVTNPIALEVFVGKGENGIAWAVSSSIGSFALSIRGTSQACAVWARQSSPADTETLFRKIVAGAARPGVDVRVVKDSDDQSSFGTVHTLIYSVSGANEQSGGFLYSMQTVEKSGGAFQASLQAAQVATP